MANIISMANQKGGVGKTTTTFNLGSALASLGHKVLLIDNDPQCNLTSYSGATEEIIQTSVDDIYVTKRKPLGLDEVINLDKKLWILPAEIGLVGAEHHLVARSDKEYVLKKALKDVATYFDFILIDNPPALNLLTVNGLVASSGVLVPVQLEFFSLEGVVFLRNTIERLQDKNPGLKLLGIVPNMFDDRRKLNWEVFEALKKEFGDVLFNTKIHDSVKIAESSGHGKSILSYSPQSRSTKEFIDLATEVVLHCEA